MKCFIAKTPKQLDICLRLLYAEKVQFVVIVEENENGKIGYKVRAVGNSERVDELLEKYRILTS